MPKDARRAKRTGAPRARRCCAGTNPDCPKKVKKDCSTFTSRTAMTSRRRRKQSEQLTESGLVKDPADLYAPDQEGTRGLTECQFRMRMGDE